MILERYLSLIKMEKRYSKPVFDKIIDGLWVGNLSSAISSELMKDIDLIINLSQNKYEKNPDKEYIDIDITDFYDSDIKKYFENITKTIKDSISNNKNVFVHCVAGISRSISIIIAYLIKYNNLSLLESFTLVKNSRVQSTIPNPGFFIQLQEYEIEIHGTSSMTIQQFVLACS
jgi:protein-tyrosine phosphatase